MQNSKSNCSNIIFNRPDIDGIKGKSKKDGKGPPGSAAAGNGTSDSFNKFYNKELKVSEGKYWTILITTWLA